MKATQAQVGANPKHAERGGGGGTAHWSFRRRKTAEASKRGVTGKWERSKQMGMKTDKHNVCVCVRVVSLCALNLCSWRPTCWWFVCVRVVCVVGSA